MPDCVREPRARRNTVGGGAAARDRHGSALHMAPADGRRAKRGVHAVRSALRVSGYKSCSHPPDQSQAEATFAAPSLSRTEGLIEIVLLSSVSLRVDAHVDGRALRQVLSALAGQ